MPCKQIRNACITINNTHSLPQSIDTTHIQYYIFGKERAPNTGTLHLQGYVEFKKLVSYKGIKKILNNNTIHIEERRGTQEQAINYCRKEDPTPFEFGEPKANGRPKGRKTQQIHDELHEVVDMLKQGHKPHEILLKEYGLYYRYKSFIMDYDHQCRMQQQHAKLLDWATSIFLNEKQQELLQAAQQQNDRQVTWVYDPVGNTGKTVWSKWMIVKHQAIRFENAKTTDLAHAYNGEPIVIFDFSRFVNERVNYGAIESLKNGMIFSGKYQSKSKIFPKGQKIIVLANFLPKTSAMSADRWDIRDWSEVNTL